MSVDLVDFDITRGSSTILKNDFSGRLMVDGLPMFPGIEGCLCDLLFPRSCSAILYVYFGFGPEEIQASQGIEQLTNGRRFI
jgi:hypothetical protein